MSVKGGWGAGYVGGGRRKTIGRTARRERRGGGRSARTLDESEEHAAALLTTLEDGDLVPQVDPPKLGRVPLALGMATVRRLQDDGHLLALLLLCQPGHAHCLCRAAAEHADNLPRELVVGLLLLGFACGLLLLRRAHLLDHHARHPL